LSEEGLEESKFGASGTERIFFQEKSTQISMRSAFTLLVLGSCQALTVTNTRAAIEKFSREYGSTGRTFKSAQYHRALNMRAFTVTHRRAHGIGGRSHPAARTSALIFSAGQGVMLDYFHRAGINSSTSRPPILIGKDHVVTALMNRRNAIGSSLGIAAVLVGPVVRVEAATDKATREANKAIAKRLIEEVWEGKDYSVVSEIVDPNYQPRDPDSAPGSNAYAARQQQTAERNEALFGELKYPIDEMIAEGDKVLVRGRVTGVHQGKKIDALFLNELQFKDGLIISGWGLTDTEAINQAL
jgi:ketosteroid isomerase-like protein